MSIRENGNSYPAGLRPKLGTNDLLQLSQVSGSARAEARDIFESRSYAAAPCTGSISNTCTRWFYGANLGMCPPRPSEDVSDVSDDDEEDDEEAEERDKDGGEKMVEDNTPTMIGPRTSDTDLQHSELVESEDIYVFAGIAGVFEVTIMETKVSFNIFNFMNIPPTAYSHTTYALALEGYFQNEVYRIVFHFVDP